MPAKLSDKKKLSKPIQVRMTIGLYNRLSVVAKDKGVGMAEYIRSVMQKKLRKV